MYPQEIKKIQVSKEIFVQNIHAILKENKTVTFTVRGNSMRPFLEDCRDSILLAPITSPIKIGDAILIKINRLIIDHKKQFCTPTYVIHRVVKIEGDDIIVWGDGNPIIKEIGYKKDIIGIAIGFYRKGRTEIEYTTSKKWIIYSKIWMFLSPFRRILLAFYRKIWIKVFHP